MGGMVYMLARALPRINDFSTKENPEIETPKTLVYIEKADEQFKKTTEKILRKIKVIVMKADNYLSDKLSGFRKKKENKNDLGFELSDEPKEEEFENGKDKI
jgi:hypothetical protein